MKALRSLDFLLVAGGPWFLNASGQPAAVPKLTLAQVEELVTHNVPDSTMRTQIQRRGLAFTPTPAVIDSLRAKGAGPLTLAAIETLFPKTTPSAVTSRATPTNKIRAGLRDPIRVGLVVVQTVPGSQLLLDRKDAGVVGPDGVFTIQEVQQGDHQLSAKHDGFADNSVTVSVINNEITKASVPLEWLGGYLSVSAQPAGARIQVTGPRSFDGAVTESNCEPGDYTVIVSSEGYVAQTRTFRLVAGDHHSETVKLAADVAILNAQLAEAKNKFAAGSLASAIESASKVVKLDSSNVEAQTILAEAYFQTGDDQGFTEAAHHAISAGGEVPLPLEHLHISSKGNRLGHRVVLAIGKSGVTYKPLSMVTGCKLQGFTQPYTALQNESVLDDGFGGLELQLEFHAPKGSFSPSHPDRFGREFLVIDFQIGSAGAAAGNSQLAPVQPPANAEQLLRAVSQLLYWAH